MNQVVIANFYQFVTLPNYQELKDPLLEFCNANELKGTILLAYEGVNCTVSGSREAVDRLYVYLRDTLNIENYLLKENFAEFHPFLRMKVRLKNEIVAMGTPGIDVDHYRGEYITPANWDEFIARDDVILVDTRNNYEVSLGSFDGAIDPDTITFREFPAWVDEHLSDKEKKIAMFCTGGVRCEKASTYMKLAGFEHVYHLQGGILQYLEDTKNQGGKWHGNCFVFDDRIAVDDCLAHADVGICRKCSKPVTSDDLKYLAGAKIDECADCNPEEVVAFK